MFIQAKMDFPTTNHKSILHKILISIIQNHPTIFLSSLSLYEDMKCQRDV